MKRRTRLLREERYTMDGYDVRIRYKNIKNLYLRISPPGVVEVSAPHRMAHTEIEGFISRRRAWIDERLRLVCAAAEAQERRRRCVRTQEENYC